MYRYSNYIARHLIHATLLITFSLTSIVWLTQALRFIDFIVNQGVSLGIFVELTALLIPSLLMMILPPAFFCAILFVYNKLKVDSELIVMQAMGLSKWRLTVPALQVGAGVMAITYVIALFIQPVSYQKFKEMQTYLRNNYVSVMLQEGVFNSPVEGLTVFIRDRDRDGTLHGILVHDTRQKSSSGNRADGLGSITMIAEKGTLVQTPQGPRFLLTNGNRQEMREGKLSYLNFASYTLDISLYTQTITPRLPDPSEMSLGQLFDYDPRVTVNENTKRAAEGHQRLIWPFYAICLALVGMASLLSGEFNRRGHWQRIAIAVAFGAAILFAAIGLRGLTSAHAGMVAVAYLNVALPCLIAGWSLSDHSVREKLAALPKEGLPA